MSRLAVLLPSDTSRDMRLVMSTVPDGMRFEMRDMGTGRLAGVLLSPDSMRALACLDIRDAGLAESLRCEARAESSMTVWGATPRNPDRFVLVVEEAGTGTTAPVRATRSSTVSRVRWRSSPNPQPDRGRDAVGDPSSRLRDYRLVTSNPGKLREFRRLGLPCEAVSIDLPEVRADPGEVAVRKAASAGPMTISEDTSLDVEGADVGIDVRWLVDDIGGHAGRRASWRVLLAVNDGESVSLHQGLVHGTLVARRGPGDFGFAPYMVPDGESRTLAELEAAGELDPFSARALAVAALLRADDPLAVVRLDALDEWTGPWQGEEPDASESTPSTRP